MPTHVLIVLKLQPTQREQTIGECNALLASPDGVVCHLQMWEYLICVPIYTGKTSLINLFMSVRMYEHTLYNRHTCKFEFS